MDIIAKNYRIDPRNIVLLKTLLDGYEGLVFLRTTDPGAGIIELLISPDFVSDVERLMTDLGRFIWMEYYVRE